MNKEDPKYTIKILCKVAKVSTSGFYLYSKEKNQRKQKDEKGFSLIKKVFEDKKGKVGAKSIKMKLEDVETIMNLKKIRRIMKKYGLMCKIRRVNKARVTLQKNKENMKVKNILNREFEQNIPYTFASTDITYLKHQNRFSFLSVTKDLATGEVLAWKLSKDMNLKLVLDTVNNLAEYFKENNLDLSKLLIHSDQGFQYTNIEYHNKLKKLKITQSMSRKGNSIDNAPIESFFGHLKDDVDYKNLSFSKLTELVTDYMLEYNNKRKQWHRQKMSPVDYRIYLLSSTSLCLSVQ